VFLGCENVDPRALCFAGLLGENEDEIRRAADLGDAFAQAEMALRSAGQERFRWAEKSAAQEERDSFCYLGHCYHVGIGCEKNSERAKKNFLVAAELGHVLALVCVGKVFDEDDPQRFVWLGRAAASSGEYVFLERNERSDSQLQFRNSMCKCRFFNRASAQRTHQPRGAKNLLEH
jgi:TPR repeat protein